MCVEFLYLFFEWFGVAPQLSDKKGNLGKFGFEMRTPEFKSFPDLFGGC
jgi:hypothetical protein